MPRPQSKIELLELSQKNFERLQTLIQSIPENKRTEDFSQPTLNRNIRDVLGHLHEWHLMMLAWYKIGMNGEKPSMPAEGYTWKTVGDLNKKIWEKYRETSLNQIQGMIGKSFVEVQKIIKKHTNEELFTKKKYPWTGSTSLGSYLISNTSSHYDWAYKMIKKGIANPK